MSTLGTLFSDIANAIRGKTGGTETMKPAEFPAAIAGIETGGGGAAVVEVGSIKPSTSGAQTIPHSLGAVPDIVVVFGIAPNNSASNIAFAYGCSAAFFSAYSPNYSVFVRQTQGTLSTSTVVYLESGTAAGSYGGIDATASNFTVGNSTTCLLANRPYMWIAIAGLT